MVSPWTFKLDIELIPIPVSLHPSLFPLLRLLMIKAIKSHIRELISFLFFVLEKLEKLKEKKNTYSKTEAIQEDRPHF